MKSNLVKNNIYKGSSVTNNINYFIEYNNQDSMNRIHNGFTWIPNNDVQLDISGGWINDNQLYIGLGVSFRIR